MTIPPTPRVDLKQRLDYPGAANLLPGWQADRGVYWLVILLDRVTGETKPETTQGRPYRFTQEGAHNRVAYARACQRDFGIHGRFMPHCVVKVREHRR